MSPGADKVVLKSGRRETISEQRVSILAPFLLKHEVLCRMSNPSSRDYSKVEMNVLKR